MTLGDFAKYLGNIYAYWTSLTASAAAYAAHKAILRRDADEFMPIPKANTIFSGIEKLVPARYF